MSRKAIIDIESYIYKACACTSTLVQLEGSTYTEGYDLEKAKEYLTKLVDDVILATGADEYIVTMGSTKNYRKFINPNYKSNRKDSPRHPMLGMVTDLVFELFETTYIPYLEADDVCRIIYEEDRFNNIIVSIDKDMKSFPCRLYNPDKPDKGIENISKEKAQANFFKQLIMGDKCDGYNGIPNYGEAKASKLVENGITQQEILDLYLANGLQESDFITTYNMARMIPKDSYSDGVVKLYNTKFNTTLEREV